MNSIPSPPLTAEGDVSIDGHRPVDRARPARAGQPARPLRIVAFPRNSRQNPHMRLLYGALEAHDVLATDGNVGALARGGYDIVHVHWPERLLNRRPLLQWRGFARFCLEMLLIRARGARLVWTIQNIKGHEERRSLLSRAFRAALVRNLAGFISLSHTAHEMALATYPALARKPSLVAPRGHYRDLYPDPPSRREARAALGLPLEGTVIGTVGLVRPYKNLPQLIRCFTAHPDPAATLLIAGECTDAELHDELIALAAADPRVRLEFGFVPEDDIPRWIRALDLAVLPYREILNSGSALLALSLDVPVMAPAMGTLVEVERAVGSSWVFTYPGELDTSTLQRAVDWSRQQRDGPAPLSYFDWQTNARRTAEFLRSLVRAPHRDR